MSTQERERSNSTKRTLATYRAIEQKPFPMMLQYEIIRTVGLVTVLAAVFGQCSKIHHQMTDAEIENIFHTSRDNVPTYDVAMLTHNIRHRRHAGRKLRLKFNAFGRKIDTYLNPSDGILAGRNTPVWLASTNQTGTIEYKKMRDDITGIVVGMYCTYTTTDTILAWQRQDDSVAFEGFLDELIIRSLPDRLQSSAWDDHENRTKRNNKTNPFRPMTYHHVIIKSNSSMDENKTLKSSQTHTARTTRSSNEPDRSRSKRSTKDIIFPTIFVQTDYKSTKTPENDFEFYHEIIYQLAFWNAVDLRFRSVSDPKIRLRISGIIIALDRQATPYINEYRQDDKWAVFPEAFSEITDYWSNISRRAEFPRDAYDIVFTLTDNDISMEYNETQIYRVPGFATTGSMCPPPNKVFDALAVVNDRGGFGGVTTAVHELGHIFGLTHDNFERDGCGASDRFIMGFNGPSENKLRWSRCSLKKLSQLLRASRIDCVDETTDFHNPGLPVRIILPGTIENADRQCRDYHYGYACEVGTSICTNMKCAYNWEDQNNTALCYDVGPAAEGTACSNDHVCLDGVCQCLTNACLYEPAEE